MLGSETDPRPIRLLATPDGTGTQYAAKQFDPTLPLIGSGGLFMRFDPNGMCPVDSPFGTGVYYLDTRYFNYSFTLGGKSPDLLRSNTEGGISCDFVYGNEADGPALPRHVIVVRREIVISEGAVFERFLVRNHQAKPARVTLAIQGDARFVDVFHVRGFNEVQRGQLALPTPIVVSGKQGLLYAYRGRDGKWLQTTMLFPFTEPTAIKGGCVVFELALEAQKEVGVGLRLLLLPPQDAPLLPFQEIKEAEEGDPPTSTTVPEGLVLISGVGDWKSDFKTGLGAAWTVYGDWKTGCTKIATSDTFLDTAVGRGLRDLYMLQQATSYGAAIAAGLPWYPAIFGRDQAITALQWLPFFPRVGRGVVNVLASLQADSDDDANCRRRGKIIHERHVGELARCDATPFKLYFGSVDSTPLWLWLFARYVKTTGDIKFARELWPKVALALDYIDRELAEGGGYLRYGTDDGQPLRNHGWKDSNEGIVRADGSLAEGSIALCEVQGYLYAAWCDLALVASAMGHGPDAAEFVAKAKALKERFNRDFWMPGPEFLALALDSKGQVDPVTSNPGHCLLTGIVSDEYASAVARMLTSRSMLTSWGVRTLSGNDKSYSPAQYHLGTCWMHDSAMVAAGLAAVGDKSGACRIFTALLQTARQYPHGRLPELVCGFDESTLINYPSSCSPQAWATGVFPQVLAACIGLEPNALTHELRIRQPQLPHWLDHVALEKLPVGAASLDLQLTRKEESVDVAISNNPERVKVTID
ncbi:MAG: hypothetical protein C5B53_06520 [Candidatus Melainabacteria bacterium]|nr:MAG: hypothetical protein C5B53_06520 [Candidatus Melainabacteria bacterium]